VRKDNRLEIVAIGRSSVDLYGEQVGGRLEDMASFAKYVGGSPTNTAVGMARLGLRSGLVTRVGADHLGRFIREQLEREQVDVTGVRDDPDRLTALAILGIRNPDDFPLIFYRENCADMAIDESDIDPALIARAGAVLINGTHLSTPAVEAASRRACELVRARGGRVVLDVDYRPVLWGLTPRDMGENRFVADAGVSARLQAILPLCDLVVGTEEEIHILGGSTDSLAALRAIRALCGALIVMKRGADGCVCFEGAIPDDIDQGVRGPGFGVEVFNVLGAGDAFMAGFLRGWLRGEPLAQCCAYGNACGAIVVSRHGCAPAMPTWPELRQFLQAKERPYRLREDAALEQTHWATTRAGQWPDLCVLAIDHRAQLIDLARGTGADTGRIAAFKSLAFDALDRVAAGRPGFGLLVDGRFGMRALERAADHPYWIGRPIELPGSRPLRFEGGPSLAATLREWPVGHVVKCLAFVHPDDAADLARVQEEQLCRLAEACRATRHELLLELIVPTGLPVDDQTVARTMRRLYEIGIHPDWWKLQPSADPLAWEAIGRAIADHDPLCRGILLLGLAAPDHVLRDAFAAVRDVPAVRGFAVGRTIWAEAARRWLAGAIDDETARAMLANRFAGLVDDWRAARSPAAQAVA
jgi:5-dehydro-2-deoxygluconokinase